ncbi:MAG: pilus (MSHA type) biogenesis protein MshL [Gammaproteobacteria bacterium]|nr:pilus (MSHA type) biogenesis protein MshL [Gammaproteobacteria bacterium]NNF60010.1 pilus (MSHA type) biogenesis protein MshL [Gammaproteobacteria bacterium]NNM20086.1 pilus (MSHA type) biogenesis protein MshL [Gammaproteobacteria bacterium]
MNSPIRLSLAGMLLLPLLYACATGPQRGVPAADAIEAAVAEAADAVQWSMPEPPPEVTDALLPPLQSAVPPEAMEPRFDVDVKDTSARAFFLSLVEGTDYNLVVHPDVRGKISLTMKNTTVGEVLDAVREVYGFDFRSSASGWIIMPASLQTRIYQVDYLNLQRSGFSRTSISSGQLSQGEEGATGNSSASQQGESKNNSGGSTRQLAGSHIDTLYQADFWRELHHAVAAIVGPDEGRRVVINPQSGVVVVRAMPDELHSVSLFLETVQATAQRQVILEAKILEIELNDGFQAGINWATVAQTADGDSYFFGQTTPDQPFNTDFEDLGTSPVTVAPGVRTLGVDSGTLGGAFAMAFDIGDFNGFIDLLEVQGDTRVLSSPRVATLNNQKAVIKAGTDEFFVTDISSNTVTGTASATSRDVELTPFFSGIALDVTPQISADGQVTLHIHPTVSEVSDQRKDLTISGETDRLPLAFSQVREADSIVRARSGQIVVIGGLMRNTSRDESFGAPGLGRLPGIGALFRSKRTVAKKTELVILLRPLIVEDDATWAQAAREPLERIRGY